MDKKDRRSLLKMQKEALRKAAMYERFRLNANAFLRDHFNEKASEQRELARDIQCQLNK